MKAPKVMLNDRTAQLHVDAQSQNISILLEKDVKL